MGLGRALPSWLVYMRARVRMLDFSSGLLQRPHVQTGEACAQNNPRNWPVLGAFQLRRAVVA